MGTVFVLIIVGAFIFGAVASWVTLFLYGRFKSRASDSDIDLPEYGNQVALTAQDISVATGRFSDENIIGGGRWSTVYKAVLRNGKTVAIKSLNVTNAEAQRNFVDEVRTLGKLRHRNLVKIIGYFSDPRTKVLVLHYMPNGSLHSHLHQKEFLPLSWRARLSIMTDIAFALVYLHHENGFGTVVHCDLKPSNILLNEGLVAHVCDFGIARLIDPTVKGHVSVTNYRGTIGYSAPEYAFSAKVTAKGDVYSYGIILLEMLTGRQPTSELLGEGETLSGWVSGMFGGGGAMAIVDPRMTKDEGEHEQEECYQMMEVMKLGLICTLLLPKDRPTMNEVLQVLLQLRKHAQNNTRGGLFPSYPSLDNLILSSPPFSPYAALLFGATPSDSLLSSTTLGDQGESSLE